MTIIKPLKTFWIYISIISVILFCQFFIPKKFTLEHIYFIIFIQVPISLISPIVFGITIGLTISKHYLYDILHPIFMSFIIFFFTTLSLLIPYLHHFFIFGKISKEIMSGIAIFSIIPALIMSILFYVTIRICNLLKKKRTNLLIKN